jgi:hypothetical protein
MGHVTGTGQNVNDMGKHVNDINNNGPIAQYLGATKKWF